jgi:hypothetical protein
VVIGEGLCEVSLRGVGGLIENIVVDGIRKSYEELPGIVEEWVQHKKACGMVVDEGDEEDYGHGHVGGVGKPPKGPSAVCKSSNKSSWLGSISMRRTESSGSFHSAKEVLDPSSSFVELASLNPSTDDDQSVSISVTPDKDDDDGARENDINNAAGIAPKQKRAAAKKKKSGGGMFACCVSDNAVRGDDELFRTAEYERIASVDA